MDTELARTFLAVAATGNFVAAASRLHVTQSTVSARIHTLETTLSARLFHRGRNGAELTPQENVFCGTPSIWCARWNRPFTMSVCRRDFATC